jgi:hypothetical protein
MRQWWKMEARSSLETRGKGNPEDFQVLSSTIKDQKSTANEEEDGSQEQAMGQVSDVKAETGEHPPHGHTTRNWH